MAEYLPATSQQQATDSPQASDESLAIQVILNQFWRDGDSRVRAVETAAWLNTCSGISAKELLSAWERYQETGSKRATGEIVKPTAVQIRAIAIGRRPRPALALESYAEPPEPVTQEQAEKIMQDANFTPKRMQAIRSNRMANTFDEALAPHYLAHWSETADPDGAQMGALAKARDENPLVKAARAARNGD